MSWQKKTSVMSKWLVVAGDAKIIIAVHYKLSQAGLSGWCLPYYLLGFSTLREKRNLNFLVDGKI